MSFPASSTCPSVKNCAPVLHRWQHSLLPSRTGRSFTARAAAAPVVGFQRAGTHQHSWALRIVHTQQQTLCQQPHQAQSKWKRARHQVAMAGGQQGPVDLRLQQEGEPEQQPTDSTSPSSPANSATSSSPTTSNGSGTPGSSGWQQSSIEAVAGGGAAAGALKLPAGYASSITSSPPSEAESKGLPHRWRVVIMMAVAFVLCNMDKVNMSVAVIPMAHELGWSALDRGLVSSSFFWGYTLTQLPGGYIATKVGGAKVLAAGVALWSFGTLIAPPAAQISLLALCASRVLVGLGEGVAPSAATTVLARLMPHNERSRAVSMVWGGLDIGSAVGLLLSGPLIRCYGWPSVFYLFAVLGLLWCVAWPLVKPDKCAATPQPDSVPSLQPSTQGGKPAQLDVPWKAFFMSPPVWAVTVAHFCFNWGYYTLLAWLPSYFELALGLNVEKSSILTLIPYVAMTCMMPLVGPIADGMVDKGVPLTWVRKICQGIAFVGPAACMVACALLTPQTVAVSASSLTTTMVATGPATGVPVAALVGLMSLAFALSAWSRAGLYCNHQDLSPKYAGTLLGITNTAGALPGVLGVTAAGYLLDATNSWALALFYPTAACQLFGAVVYSLFASSERQPWS